MEKPHPEYLRNSINLVEAEIQLKQSHLDALTARATAEFEWDEDQAAARAKSNPTSTTPARLRQLARIRLNEQQTHLACLQVELRKMIGQRDTWKQLLADQEEPLVTVPETGRITLG